MKLNKMYQGLGISPAVYEYGEAVLKDLRERFDAIDQAAEYNQAKVLSAFQKNRVDAACFAATTGYGYNDVGREKLELVCAQANEPARKFYLNHGFTKLAEIPGAHGPLDLMEKYIGYAPRPMI